MSNKLIEEYIQDEGLLVVDYEISKVSIENAIREYRKRLIHLRQINKVNDVRYSQINTLLNNLINHNNIEIYNYYVKLKNDMARIIVVDVKQNFILGVLEMDKWFENGKKR